MPLPTEILRPWYAVGDSKLISLSTPVCAEILTEAIDPKQKGHLQKPPWNMEFFFFPSDEAFFMHGFHSPHSEECCYQATGITMTQVLSFSLSVSLSSSDRGFCTLSSIMLNGTCCKFSMNLLHYRYIYIYIYLLRASWSGLSFLLLSLALGFFVLFLLLRQEKRHSPGKQQGFCTWM